jgi:hypothetical protein
MKMASHSVGEVALYGTPMTEVAKLRNLLPYSRTSVIWGTSDFGSATSAASQRRHLTGSVRSVR